MNAIPDKVAQWDAAYVLERGLLMSAVVHLASCPTCQSAVSERAGSKRPLRRKPPLGWRQDDSGPRAV